jgi:formylmethanofuran dehydrogenase subunit D
MPLLKTKRFFTQERGITLMEELTLKVQKRAFPSEGRARIHNSSLSSLGIVEGDLLEVGLSGGKTISVAAYGDSFVETDTIRLSEQDLEKLGVTEGAALIVQKKPALTEQMKQSAQSAAGQISVGLDGVKESVSGVVGPAAEKTSHAVKGAYEKVSAQMPTREDLANVVEAAKKKLGPSDAKRLQNALEDSKGSIKAVTISKSVGGSKVGATELPEGVVIVAIQRNDTVLIPTPETTIAHGDIVYLVGTEEGIAAATNVIGE